MKHRSKAIFFLLGMLLLDPHYAPAQTALPTSVAAAGAVETANAFHHIRGTIGQAAVGFVAAGDVRGALGFWLPSSPGGAAATDYSPTVEEGPHLLRSSPNPFAESTRLSVTIPRREEISLLLVNVLGQPVRTLLRGEQEAGQIELMLNGEDLPSGRYTLMLKTPGAEESIPLLLVR